MKDRVMRRLFNAVEKASGRYNVCETAIKTAMADALRLYLDANFGYNQNFEVFWQGNSLIAIRILNMNSITPFKELDFTLEEIGEFRVREILQTFQIFLDNADALGVYERVKSLTRDIIRGKVIHYVNGEATVSFYDHSGYELHGFCASRHLLPGERDFTTLIKRDLSLFYVRNVQINGGTVRINLSRKSIRIPELIIKEALQNNGFDIANYRFKCVRRIGGRRSLVVSIGKLPKEIHMDAQAALGKEALRIFAINKYGQEAKLFYQGLIGFEELAARYINLSTIKNLSSPRNLLIKHNDNRYKNGSFFNRLSGNVS